MFDGSNRLLKFTGEVYGSRLWLIFYGDEFYVNFRVVILVAVYDGIYKSIVRVVFMG